MNRLGLLLAVILVSSAQAHTPPRFPTSRETTYVTGPFDKEGYLDYTTALNGRLGKGITPDTNAAVLLWKAIGPRTAAGAKMPDGFFRAMGVESPPDEGAYFVAYRDHVKEEPADHYPLHEDLKTPVRKPWDAKDHPKVADWINANEESLALAIAASRRTQFFNPILGDKTNSRLDIVFPAGSTRLRDLCTGLTVRSTLRAGTGDFENAWGDSIAARRIARLMAQGGSAFQLAIGLCADQEAVTAQLAILEVFDIDARRMRTCFSDLDRLPLFPSAAATVDLLERFSYLGAVQFLRRGGDRKLTAEAKAGLALIDWDEALRDGNRWYDRVATALRLENRTQRKKEHENVMTRLSSLVNSPRTPPSIEKLLTELGKAADEAEEEAAAMAAVNAAGKAAGTAISTHLLGFMMVNMSGLAEGLDENEQVQRNLRIAVALAGFKHDHGRHPAKLEELAPRYLASVPTDLFSGKRLSYRRLDSGYLLYSVGPNQEDDQGRLKTDDPPGDDIGIRMGVEG